MARNTSVEIGDELARFVKDQVEAGRYGSASCLVVRASEFVLSVSISLNLLDGGERASALDWSTSDRSPL